MSIGNLPAELALDASVYFGDSLLPHVKNLVLPLISFNSFQLTEKDPSGTLKAATITSNGLFLAPHKHLLALTQEATISPPSLVLPTAYITSKNRILVLGSGFVVLPAVDFFARLQGAYVTVGTSTFDVGDAHSVPLASNNLDEALQLAKNRENVSAILCNVSDAQQLRDLISKHDLVLRFIPISLLVTTLCHRSFLPATMHVEVAKLCIATGRNMVTASYISPEMAKLDGAARECGISILNEMGLDPGIDHMIAMKVGGCGTLHFTFRYAEDPRSISRSFARFNRLVEC